MIDRDKWMPRRARLALGGAMLVALGAAGGAGAASMTRPAVEMAPANPVAIASLPQRQGIVTVKGTVAEVYGDRFVVADASGRTMVDAGRGAGAIGAGARVTVQGRFDNGQLRASFVVGPDGTVEPLGRGGRHGGHDPRHGDRDHDAPPPPPGCAPAGGPVPAPAGPVPAPGGAGGATPG